MTRLYVAAATFLSPILSFGQGTPKEGLERLVSNDLNRMAMENQTVALNVAIWVPIAFFIFIFGLVFAAYYWRYRQSKELQSSIRLMVEKGVNVPIEFLTPKVHTSYVADMRKGLILTFLGVALPIALGVSSPEDSSWVWGLIPLALGIAYILSARIAKKSESANG